MRSLLKQVIALSTVAVISSYFVSSAFCESLQRPMPPALDVRTWTLPEWLQQAAAEPGAAIPAREISIAGTWGGFCTIDRDFYRTELTLTLNPAERETAAGRIQFFSLKTIRNGQLEAEPRHTAEAVAKYDPIGSTLELKITNWTGKGFYDATDTLQMDGVVTFQPDRIAGECVRTRKQERFDRETPQPQTIGYGYVLARDPSDIQSLVAKVKALANLTRDALKAYSGRRVEPNTDPRIVDQLVGLDSELRTIFPKIDPMKVQSQNHFPAAAHLFSDEIFQRHFGMKFDELDVWESKRIGHTIQLIGKGQSEENRLRLKPLGYLSSYFSSGGSFNRAVVISHLLPRREVRRWVSQQLKRGNQLGFTQGADTELSRVRYDFNSKLGMLTQSEKASAVAAIDVYIDKLAGPMLERGVAKLLTRRPDEMYFYSLESWQASSGFDPSLLDERHFERLQEAVDSRIDNLLETRLQADVDRISQIGNDFESISKVTRAYFELLPVYRRHDTMLQLTPRPSFQLVLKYVTDLRRYLLNRHQDRLIARIQEAASREELDSIVSSILSIPNSIEQSLREKINQANEKQIAKIDHEAWLAMLSVGERELLDANGKIQVPLIPTAPTEDEIRRALPRSMADIYGSMVGPYRYQHNIAALTILTRKRRSPDPDGMTIEYLEVQFVKPVERSNDVANLFSVCYRCRMHAQMLKPVGEVPSAPSALLPRRHPSIEKEDERLRSDATMRGMVNVVSEFASGGWSEVTTETFHLTSRGWRSPSIVEGHVFSRPFAQELFLRYLIDAANDDQN